MAEFTSDWDLGDISYPSFALDVCEHSNVKKKQKRGESLFSALDKPVKLVLKRKKMQATTRSSAIHDCHPSSKEEAQQDHSLKPTSRKSSSQEAGNSDKPLPAQTGPRAKKQVERVQLKATVGGSDNVPPVATPTRLQGAHETGCHSGSKRLQHHACDDMIHGTTTQRMSKKLCVDVSAAPQSARHTTAESNVLPTSTEAHSLGHLQLKSTRKLNKQNKTAPLTRTADANSQITTTATAAPPLGQDATIATCNGMAPSGTHNSVNVLKPNKHKRRPGKLTTLGSGAPSAPLMAEHVEKLQSQGSPGTVTASNCHLSDPQQSLQPPQPALPPQKQQQQSTTHFTSAQTSSVLDRILEKSQGSRFRYLNEVLYTTTGEQAHSTMQGNQDMFKQYHQGFQSQTRSWPVQPVDLAIQWLRKQSKELVVADFGCGDARLGRTVQQVVHSLDLVASAPGVIACNMAHTPLADGCIDVAVFSLSLMGTDYGSFLVEAARLLRPKGWLWIAEVRSRFVGPDNCEDLAPFIKALKRLGFVLKQQDTSNKMFVVLVLRKIGTPQPGAQKMAWPPLRACQYKKR